MKKRFKRTWATAIMAMTLFALTLVFCTAIPKEVNAAHAAKNATTVKKPGKVTGLKKVKVNTKWNGYRNVGTAKIKYKKVKGAAGYQILIYQPVNTTGYDTPLLYAKTTKKTTYTIQNLVPGFKYTIKVRAYKKGKNGKMVYGKYTTIKVKVSGKRLGSYYTCRTCLSVMPDNDFIITEHGESVWNVHHELHAGGSCFFCH